MKGVRIISEIYKGRSTTLQTLYKCELSLSQQEYLRGEAGGMHPFMHAFTQFISTVCILSSSFTLGTVGTKMNKTQPLLLKNNFFFFLVLYFLNIFFHFAMRFKIHSHNVLLSQIPKPCVAWCPSRSQRCFQWYSLSCSLETGAMLLATKNNLL